MKSLSHNGIIIPEYDPKGFSIKFKGKTIKLDPHQEEMAIAWVRKLGTPYVEDKVFIKNFFEDFCKALRAKGSREDFNFSEIEEFVNKERGAKENMSKEEKKKLAAERKKVREENKEKYGYAEIDGERVALGNYMAEPSGIFMGRGKHPLRGRWKEGAKESDVALNMSPDAKRPPGKWKEIVWMPDCMWIAKWTDKLTGKEKYVWLADSSPIKQRREMEKFDKAMELDKNRNIIHDYIMKNLDSNDLKTRKLATVCYLIETVCMRVGDEKDEDEANTVGATTLTRDNISIEGNIVKFDFLGKDSVRWQKEIETSDIVIRNLKEFMKEPDDVIFNGIRSEHVNEFLSNAMKGLTTKVFRTSSATKAVREFLKENENVKENSEYYKKHVAKLANLQAAIVCNHKRTIPKTWEASLDRKKGRLNAAKEKAKENMEKYEKKIKELKIKNEKQVKGYEDKLKDADDKKAANLKERIKKAKQKYAERLKKLNEQMENRKRKDLENIKKQEMQLEEQRQTRDYNLNTSLKSYVDPRTYYRWAKKVGYDWKKYYSSTLQRKFSWVDEEKSCKS